MTQDGFDLRRAKALRDKTIFEDVVVVSGPGDGLESLISTMSMWAQLDEEVQRVRTSPGLSRLQRSLDVQMFEGWRDRLKVPMVLRTRRTFVEVSGVDIQLECSDTEAMLMLTPKGVKVMPDGSYVFEGVHHALRSWSRNYNAGIATDHTYTTYRVSVGSSGVGVEVVDVERDTTS